MRTMCLVCNADLPNDPEYINHMQTVHGTSSPDQAFKIQKSKEANLPKDIPPEALPTPEFMEVANMLDNPPNPPSPTDPPPKPPQPTPEPQPIQLEYKYSGQHSCGNTVKTIMIKDTAVAYCLICDKSVQEIEVQPINRPNKIEDYFSSNNPTRDIIEVTVNKILKPKRKEKNVKPTNLSLTN